MQRPLLTEHDVYLLAEGTYRRSYDRLGAHPMVVDGVRGTHFAVWAPHAEGVGVVGSFNDWDGATHPMLRHGTSGIWELFVPGAGPGALYKYRIAGWGGGPPVDKADPYAFQAEAPPGTASVVCALEGFPWEDAPWLAGRRERQRPDRPLAIYEVHAGSWRRVPEQGGRSLGYRELAHQLVPYAVDLGFTHVELMPITEYPTDASWGYQVTGYYAPTARYGTPHDFMYFVDYCHRRGLGVILDWVPAHFAKEGHGLGFFDGTHLYEHADPRLGEHPTWGTYIFNYGRAEVRNFLLSSALFWLEQYHVDGFRVDAVASMIWLDHARPESHWGTNPFGGRENLDAVDFLRRFNALVHGSAPGALTMAEESTSYSWVTGPPSAALTPAGAGAPLDAVPAPAGAGAPLDAVPAPAGGEVKPPLLQEEGDGGEGRAHTLGFDYKWNLGWMHDTLDYFETDPVHRSAHHHRLTWPIWYAFDERYVLPLSHDEVVHLKKALLTKMPGDDWQRFAGLRALLAYQYSHPGKKLLFMGGEFGQWAEWSEGRSLDWHLLEHGGAGGSQAPLHRGLQRCVRELNRLHAAYPALHQLDSRRRGFDWIENDNRQGGVIAFLRRGIEPGEIVAAVCNFTPVVRESYPIGVPIPGQWQEVLNTDSREYGGSGVVNGGPLWAAPGRQAGRFRQSLSLTLPPLAVLYVRPRSPQES